MRVPALLLTASFAVVACNKTPPALPDEPPRPGDPVVKLLEPGAEPRSPLRYAVPVGRSERLVMDMGMEMQMNANGQATPAVKTPTTHATMVLTSGEVNTLGTAHVTGKMDGMDVLPGTGDVMPAMVDMMKKEMAGMVGMTMDMRITARGVVRDAQIKLPDTASPMARTIMDGMRKASEQVAMPFPVEAVGVGARWEIHTSIEATGIKLKQTVLAKLDRREPTRAFLSLTIEQTADPQPMNTPGLPPGAEAHLDSWSGKGQGKTEVPLDSRASTTENATESHMKYTVKMQGQSMPFLMDMKANLTMKPAPNVDAGAH